MARRERDGPRFRPSPPAFARPRPPSPSLGPSLPRSVPLSLARFPSPWLGPPPHPPHPTPPHGCSRNLRHARVLPRRDAGVRASRPLRPRLLHPQCLPSPRSRRMLTTRASPSTRTADRRSCLQRAQVHSIIIPLWSIRGRPATAPPRSCATAPCPPSVPCPSGYSARACGSALITSEYSTLYTYGFFAILSP